MQPIFCRSSALARCQRLATREGVASNRSNFAKSVSTSTPCYLLTDEWRRTLGKDKVVSSPYPRLEIPNVTYPQFAFNQMEKFQQATFLVNGETGAKYSFHEALREVSRVSSALIRLGLKRGDRVAFYSFNRPEYALAWFAVTAVGAVATDANPNFTVDELRNQLTSTSSKFLFTHEINAETAKAAVIGLPTIEKVFVFGESPGSMPYSELTKDSGDLFHGPVSADPSDIVHLPNSSGTTGLPKSVLRSHLNLVATTYVTNHEELQLFTDYDVTLMVLPLFHMYGCFMLGCCLLVGSTAVFQEKFAPEATLAIMQQNKVTNFPCVPPLIMFLAQHPLVSRYDLSSLESLMCGAAPVSPNIMETVAQKFNLRYVGQGYGLTEMCPISISPKSEGPLAAVGLPVSNTDIKVVSLETGEDLNIGERGEIYARGPTIMSGYENDKNATESTLVDGWLKTGDIGYISSEGYVYIMDRLKDFIKVKGHQVAPAELEAVLLTHPSVLDVAVIGVPDERAGEVPRAFVVLKDKDTEPQQLEAFVAERLSPEKHLTGGIFFVNEIPKSPSGKILKKELRK